MLSSALLELAAQVARQEDSEGDDGLLFGAAHAGLRPLRCYPSALSKNSAKVPFGCRRVGSLSSGLGGRETPAEGREGGIVSYGADEVDDGAWCWPWTPTRMELLAWQSGVDIDTLRRYLVEEVERRQVTAGPDLHPAPPMPEQRCEP
jgi:hypothetical protein